MSDRTVTTDALATLGTIIDDTAKRDAIHLAVIPAIAGIPLHPGNHVELIDGIARRTATGEGIGIVDPFLAAKVQPGERFWLVIYPRKINSLRHVWTHPALPDESIVGKSDEEIPPAIKTLRKQQSETWLRGFCASSDCPDYETVLELIDKGSLPSSDSEYYPSGGEYTEEYLHFSGTDAHGTIPIEFWEHVEVVLGRKTKYRPQYFSCSC